MLSIQNQTLISGQDVCHARRELVPAAAAKCHLDRRQQVATAPHQWSLTQSSMRLATLLLVPPLVLLPQRWIHQIRLRG